MAEMGAMPVYNVGENNNDAMGGGWMWIIILLFLIGGGNGFGGQNALGKAELCEGFNFNNLENGVRGIQSGLCDGFYAQNTTMLQGFNGVDRGLCDVGHRIDSCCCETNRNIDALRYEAAKNTCDITTAIRADGDATRALINANVMQELRDQLQDAKNSIVNTAQTQTLIGSLKPYPVPAYVTCSPYQAQNFFNGGCGCNTGCGCGC